MKKHFLFTVITLFAVTFVSAQQVDSLDIYEKKEFAYNGNVLPYRILYPANYDKSKKYPLLLFLHGAGERGMDNQKQLTWGGNFL